jgi:hypothetical protein
MASAANDVVMVAMRVTPAVARRWLKERSPEGYNRDVREAHVRSLAEEIAGDRFKCTPQPLIFSDESRLSDGQHRLHAIALANTAVWVRVAYHPQSDIAKEIKPGLPPTYVCSDDVSGPLDCGMPRPAYVIRGLQSDRNFGYERRIQAIVHALDVHKGDDRPRVTPGHIDAVVARRKGAIQWATEAISHNLQANGAAALAIAWGNKDTRSKVEEFAAIIDTKAWHNDKTGMAFRAWEIMKERRVTTPAARRDMITRILRCAETFCAGRKVKQVRASDYRNTFAEAA